MIARVSGGHAVPVQPTPRALKLCEGFKVVTAAGLFAGEPPPPPDYVLGNLVVGLHGQLIGADGVGKSMFALQMAAAVCCGIAVAGGAIPAPEVTGPVLYVCGEDDINHVHRRLLALREQLDEPDRIRFDAGTGDLRIGCLDNHRLPLMVPSVHGGEPDECEGNINALLAQASGCRLVILDPLVMFHALSENDNGQMDALGRQLARIGRQVGGAVISVHHSGQVAYLSGRDDHHVGRGATAFTCAARQVWILRHLVDQDEKECGRQPTRIGLRVLRASKVSRGPEEERVFLRLGGQGVLSLLDPPQRAARSSGFAVPHDDELAMLPEDDNDHAF